MSRFETCLNFVMGWEGGYGNDSADRGGPTNRGITRATYDAYRISRGLGRSPVVGISGDEVLDIYRTRYWRPVCGDSLPKRVDLVVFDAAVNCGVKRASIWLQRAVGADEDGQIGKYTLAAVDGDNRAGLLDVVIADMIDQRHDFYEALAERDPSQQKFLKGWLNRLAALAKEVRPC